MARIALQKRTGVIVTLLGFFLGIYCRADGGAALTKALTRAVRSAESIGWIHVGVSAKGELKAERIRTLSGLASFPLEKYTVLPVNAKAGDEMIVCLGKNYSAKWPIYTIDGRKLIDVVDVSGATFPRQNFEYVVSLIQTLYVKSSVAP